MRVPRSRPGLAPLEFVLWLPVLLAVTALMVVYGTMAAWRVRGEIVARDAVWRIRWPRTGATEPRPPVNVWPANAQMAVAPAPPFTVLNTAVTTEPVVRGPLPGGFLVRNTLDPTRRPAEGRSQIVRQYPLLPKLGPYRSGQIRHPLLMGEWRIAEMGAPNKVRRTLILYQFPRTDQSLPMAFANEVQALVSMPNFTALNVLDADEEIRKYTGGYRDFHPRVALMCTLDRKRVYQQRVLQLVDHRDAKGRVQLGRISRLPRTMTNFFLSMYQSRVEALKNQIKQMQQQQNELPGQISGLQQQISQLQSQLASGSPQVQSEFNDLSQQHQSLANQLDGIPDQIDSAQSEIATLEPKISQLEAYKGQLDEIESQLRAEADAVLP